MTWVSASDLTPAQKNEARALYGPRATYDFATHKYGIYDYFPVRRDGHLARKPYPIRYRSADEVYRNYEAEMQEIWERGRE